MVESIIERKKTGEFNIDKRYFGKMILWDKKPEVRARTPEILANPDDPLFFMTAADYLAQTTDVPTAIRTIGTDNLVHHWKGIKKEMRLRGATKHRVDFWEEIASKLAARRRVKNRDKPERVSRKNSDPALTLFGSEVREKRRHANMTGAELASAMGTTPAIISRMERGLYNPSLRFLFRLGNVLGWETIPGLYSNVRLPVRIETANGELLLTDGKDAMSLTPFADDFTSAGCGAEMFGYCLFMAMQRLPKDRQEEYQTLFDAFCEQVKSAGITLTDAFRVWYYQYHTLRPRSIRADYLQDLIFRAANGWIHALSGAKGFSVDAVRKVWPVFQEYADAEPQYAQLERFTEVMKPDLVFPDEDRTCKYAVDQGVSPGWLSQVRSAEVPPVEWPDTVMRVAKLLEAISRDSLAVDQ